MDSTQQLVIALSHISPDVLRSRLAELSAEQQAIRTLLRATLARQHADARRQVARQEAAAP
jgi:hypothetical protein